MSAPVSLPADIFVGRQPELDRLLEAATSARLGRGRLVLLSGEPGIGKTRTAAELGARAGIRLLWGRCHETAGAPPYWPWTQVLRGPLGDLDLAALREDLGPGAADIADIVPDLRERLPDLEPSPASRDPAGERFRLFDSLTRFLLATARRQPLMIVLDDLHWADVPSLRLLEFLAPEIATGRILLVGTYRETELSRHHPLSDALGGLIREAHVARLRLTGLDGEEVRHFVALAAGVVPPAALTHSIHQQTEGNPLFVREIVRLLSEQGHFESGPTAAPAAIRIPEGIRDVIGRRLNRLSPDCNEVLTLAAVAGRDFAADVLAQASGKPEDAMLRALDEAVEARVLEEGGPSRFQFTHALIRETLYDEIRPGQRRRLHRVVGEALEAAARRDPGPVLPDLARHFQAAGTEPDLLRAIFYAAAAGARANAALAYEAAAMLFQSGLDMIEQVAEPDDRTQAALLFGLGDALRRTNDYPNALPRLRQAARLARAKGFHDILADAATSYEVAQWRWGQRPEDDTVAFLTDALNALPETEPAARIRVMASLGRGLLYTGRREPATVLVREAMARARALGDAAAITAVVDVSYEFESELPDRRHLDEAIEMARVADQLDDIELSARFRFQRAIYQMVLGEADESRQTIKEFTRLQERIRQPVFALFALGLRIAFTIYEGKLADAEALIRNAVRMRSPAGTHATDVTAVPIFDLRRAQGRLGEMRPLIQVFAQTSGNAAWRPGLALALLETGDTAAAKALLRALAADDWAAVPRDGRWTASLIYLAEVAAAVGDADKAAALYPHLRPWTGRCLVLGGGASIAGSADRFLGLLAATLRHWTEAEAHFATALATNERTGGRLPLAHTQIDYAAMLLARGFPGDAARAAGLLDAVASAVRALGLAGLLPAIERLTAAAPATVSAAPDDLTSREIEVLRLLAIGRSNADVALALSISLNTVATHVRNILAKTGCANRTEAAAYAMRNGLHAG